MSQPEAAFTFRDRVKLACLQRCIEIGLDEAGMIDLFHKATEQARSQSCKSGSLGWVAPTASSLGYLALLGIPGVALGSAALGHIAGGTAKNIEIGRIPSTEEIKLLDEIAAYHRTADEIKRRTEENEEEQKKRSKPSVHRMF